MQLITNNVEAKRRLLLITSVVSILYLCFLIVISLFSAAGSFTFYLQALLVIYVVQLALLFTVKQWMNRIIYISILVQLILIFYTIIRLGGISNSAGILMFAYFLLITCLWLEDIRLLLVSAVIFIASVIVCGILFPFLHTDPNLTGWKNNLFFAVNFGAIGLLAALTLYNTILKNEEAAARQAHKLEEMNNLKTRLYDNLAHEFRTPLTLIRGYSEEMATNTDEEIKNSAGSIMINSDELLLMINRMLDLSPEQNSSFNPERVANDICSDISQTDTDLYISPDVEIAGQRKILIIEDNQELLDYLVHLLEDEYLVITSRNGEQGIELAFRVIPDIILSDIMMPGKDGYEVCAEIKKDFRTNHIPVVLLTAKAGKESRILGYEHGADAYLTKPFDKKDLKICLRNLLIQREKLKQKYLSGIYEPKTGITDGNVSELFLENLKRVLEKNYRNSSFSTEDLSNETGIGRAQLNRKLSAITGLTSSLFIRNFRLNKGLSLLRETNLTVAEIAYETGFTDPNYFTRAFTTEYGLTPKQVRS